MKKLYMFSCAVMLVFGMAGVASAIPFSMMNGDNDGYGFGVADNGTAVWPGYVPYDGRSAAEAAATDGTQITDVYSAIFIPPNYGPNPYNVADVVFDLMAGSLNSAILEIDMGDFQASPFGQIDVYFNGVVQTNLFNFNDGFQSTAIRQFALDSNAMANANTAGEFVLTLDRANSRDFIAFDYFELSGDIEPIPEPATMLLFGTGLVGLIGYNRKRFSKKK
jgi:hypothetical protein